VMPNANSFTPASAPPSSALPTQTGCPTVPGTNGCTSDATPTTPAGANPPRPSPQSTLQPSACPNGQVPPPGATACP
jgi:hypothetical protein